MVYLFTAHGFFYLVKRNISVDKKLMNEDRMSLCCAIHDGKSSLRLLVSYLSSGWRHWRAQLVDGVHHLVIDTWSMRS